MYSTGYRDRVAFCPPQNSTDCLVEHVDVGHKKSNSRLVAPMRRPLSRVGGRSLLLSFVGSRIQKRKQTGESAARCTGSGPRWEWRHDERLPTLHAPKSAKQHFPGAGRCPNQLGARSADQRSEPLRNGLLEMRQAAVMERGHVTKRDVQVAVVINEDVR